MPGQTGMYEAVYATPMGRIPWRFEAETWGRATREAVERQDDLRILRSVELLPQQMGEKRS